MKTIKILHIFPRLLSLYGEYANVTVLKYYLEKNGFTVNTEGYENGDLSLDDADFIYIGAGTEANTEEAIKRLMPHKQTIEAAVKAGKIFLATGNSMAIFGESLKTKKEELSALGIFPYKTQESEKRFIGDALTKQIFNNFTVGFINTSYIYEGITEPLFELALGDKLGNDKKSKWDGFRVQNFFATQLTGPVIVKNPHILSYLAELITDKPLIISSDENIKEAHSLAMAQLAQLISKEMN